MATKALIQVQLMNNSGVIIQDWQTITDVTNDSQIIAMEMDSALRRYGGSAYRARVRAVDEKTGSLIDVR